MVVDTNAPDMLHQDGPDFGWLDEACKVKGDQLTIPDDEDSELDKESEEEAHLSDPNAKGKQMVSWCDLERGSAILTASPGGPRTGSIPSVSF